MTSCRGLCCPLHDHTLGPDQGASPRPANSQDDARDLYCDVCASHYGQPVRGSVMQRGLTRVSAYRSQLYAHLQGVHYLQKRARRPCFVFQSAV